MELASHARVTIPRPREEVFDYLTDTDAYRTYLLKHGPIAGIVRVEMVDGAPVAKGNRRLVFMTDGSVLDETIVAYDRPDQHAYRWTETLKPPFSWLVRGGGGHWTFRDDEEGTRVDWRYTFEPRSGIAHFRPAGARREPNSAPPSIESTDPGTERTCFGRRTSPGRRIVVV